MITYQEAMKILLDKAPELDGGDVLLTRAVGRIASRDVIAPEDYPRFPNSSMDGFAVVADEVKGASKDKPVAIKVCGTTVAGDKRLRGIVRHANECHEIMTGAPIPEGYDTIIQLEDVIVQNDADGHATSIIVMKPVAKGTYLRAPGEDIKAGSVVLKKGEMIAPEHILILSTLGVQSVPVMRKPRVVIISTGGELGAKKGEDKDSGLIRNSTGPWLQAFMPQIHAEIPLAVEVGDDAEKFTHVFTASLARGVDIIISTGGVSMGQHDFVVGALDKLGVEVHFHKLAIRPGKPMLFGTLKKVGKENVYVFGLPGNPASSICCARFLVEPFIRKMLGQEQEAIFDAKLTCDFKKSEGMQCFYPAKLEFSVSGVEVTPLPNPASFKVKPFSQGNGWVILDLEEEELKKGAIVKCAFTQSDSRLDRVMGISAKVDNPC